MQLDPSFLQSEGLPPSHPRRTRCLIVWITVLAAIAGSALFLLAHVVPAAGAAGGCGGG